MTTSIGVLGRLEVTIAIALLIALVVSIFAVVSVSHLSRLKFGELERVRKQSFDLHGEATRVLLEYQALASLAEVQASAQAKLSMHIVTPESMVVLK